MPSSIPRDVLPAQRMRHPHHWAVWASEVLLPYPGIEVDRSGPLHEDRARGVAGYSQATSPSRWRLLIYLQLRSRRRIASIDYLDRDLLETQLWQFNQTGSDQYALLDFNNELGDSLAVVSCAYLRHEIRLIR